MINFIWNGVQFDITDIGGGKLGEYILPHSHAAGSYELHYITNGKGTLIADKTLYLLKRGDFFITGANIVHEQGADSSDPVEDVFVNIQVKNSKNANCFADLFLQNKFCFFENYDNTAAIRMLYEYKSKKAGYACAVSAFCSLLLTQAARKLIPDATDDSVVYENLNERRFVIIEQAFLYDKNITLSSLSEKIGLCERQTQRLLKKYYSKTFREKKNEIKGK